MEGFPNRKKLSQKEKEEWLNDHEEPYKIMDRAIPEYGLINGRRAHALVPFFDFFEDENCDYDALVPSGKTCYVPYESRIHFSNTCGAQRERILIERFNKMPISAQSIKNDEDEMPQMHLLPIHDINSERLLTLRPQHQGTKRSLSECGESGEVDTYTREYDFFPAGMTLNLALESCLQELKISFDAMEANFNPNLKVTSERDALYVVVVMLSELAKQTKSAAEKRAQENALLSALNALTPFVYTPKYANSLPYLIAFEAVHGKEYPAYGSIYTRFDAIYYSLLFFISRSIRRCKYCDRFFFSEAGKQEYCLFNCPDADGRPCKGDGIRWVARKDEITFTPKVDKLRRNIRKRLEKKGETKEYSDEDSRKMINQFQEEYYAKKDELFKDYYKPTTHVDTHFRTEDINKLITKRKREQPWKKWQLLYEWLVDYNNHLDEKWKRIEQ